MPLAKLRQRAMVGMFVGCQVAIRDILVGLRLDLARAVAPDHRTHRWPQDPRHPPHPPESALNASLAANRAGMALVAAPGSHPRIESTFPWPHLKPKHPMEKLLCLVLLKNPFPTLLVQSIANHEQDDLYQPGAPSLPHHHQRCGSCGRSHPDFVDCRPFRRHVERCP